MGQSAAGARALLAAGVGLAWVVFYGAWLAVKPGGEDALRIFADTAYLIPLASATALCVYAWRRVPQELRPFWALMSAASGAWLTADTLWCVRDLLVGSVPYPWWSDAGYIASYAFLLCAVYTAFRPRFRTIGAERLLDGALVVGALGLAWWWLLLRPVEPGLSVTSFFDLAYPGFGLLLIGLLVTTRLLPSRQGTLAMWLVAGGICAGIFADAVYLYSSGNGGYLTGGWVEISWQIEGVLFSLAALYAAGGLGRPPDWMAFREWPRLTPAILTSSVLAVGSVLLAADAAAGPGISRGLMAGLGLLAVLLTARLWVAARPARTLEPDPAARVSDAGYFGARLRRQTIRGRHFAEPFAVAVAAPDGPASPTAGSTLLREVRERGTVSRLRDGRFGILLPQVEQDNAIGIVDRLREAVAERDGTYSIGLGVWSVELTPPDLLEQAEEALALARRLGGNQVRTPIAGAIDDWDAAVSLAELVERREGLPAGHSEQVASLAEELAREIGLDGELVRRAYLGGYLHDIGKVGIPSSLLRKRQMLDRHEWETVRRHPEHGAAILQGLGDLREAGAIVLAHHERWDGQGYPHGVSGESIPPEARVVAVANSIVAMTSERPQRPALSETTALTAIWRLSGDAYDPVVVRALLGLSREGRLPRLQPAQLREPRAPRAIATGTPAY